jgi:hypothetical protein
MKTQEMTLEQVLEQGEGRFPHIVGLYQWSTNYEAGKTPFTLFIDLIGWSAEEYGSPLFDLSNVHRTLGYLELDYLGDALKEYADKGESAYDFVVRILEAEGR